MKKRKVSKRIGPEWWFEPPFMAIPSSLYDSRSWKALSHPAMCLYISMRASVGSKSEARPNWKPEMMRFGHARVKDVMSKGTYTRAMKELEAAGFIEILHEGGHGKEGLYDITSQRWCFGGTMEEGKYIYN